MKLELYISGIGGQGIQLLSKVLAMAAIAEGRYVLLASEYGFTMRGGLSLATMVIASRPVTALPVIAAADAAIVLHQQYLDTPASRLRPNALVVTDVNIVDKLPPLPTQNIKAFDALGIAREVGSTMTAGLALLSYFNSTTGLVATDSLVKAMKELIPSYRSQHIENNEKAIRLAAERTPVSSPIDLDEVQVGGLQ